MASGFSDSRRKSVLNMSGGKCWYCGNSLTIDTLTVDHVLPVAEGGSNDPQNLVPSCKSCNSKKKHKSMEEFRAIMSRTDGWVRFSQEQKNFLLTRAGVDIDKVLSGDDYVFWFERNG
jgi:5-methylcytosine-specific restriction endonuclease McrA